MLEIDSYFAPRLKQRITGNLATGSTESNGDIGSPKSQRSGSKYKLGPMRSFRITDSKMTNMIQIEPKNSKPIIEDD